MSHSNLLVQVSLVFVYRSTNTKLQCSSTVWGPRAGIVFSFSDVLCVFQVCVCSVCAGCGETHERKNTRFKNVKNFNRGVDLENLYFPVCCHPSASHHPPPLHFFSSPSSQYHPYRHQCALRPSTALVITQPGQLCNNTSLVSCSSAGPQRHSVSNVVFRRVREDNETHFIKHPDVVQPVRLALKLNTTIIGLHWSGRRVTERLGAWDKDPVSFDDTVSPVLRRRAQIQRMATTHVQRTFAAEGGWTWNFNSGWMTSIFEPGTVSNSCSDGYVKISAVLPSQG